MDFWPRPLTTIFLFLFDISHQVCSHNKPPRHTAAEKPCSQGGSARAWVGGCHVVDTQKAEKNLSGKRRETSQAHPHGRRHSKTRHQASPICGTIRQNKAHCHSQQKHLQCSSQHVQGKTTNRPREHTQHHGGRMFLWKNKHHHIEPLPVY